MKNLTTAALFNFILLISTNIMAQQKVSLGQFKILDLVNSTMKFSVELRNDKNEIINIDCLDGRQPSNTVLFISSKQSYLKNGHKTFLGGNDFYCSGLSSTLFRHLSVGENVELALDLNLISSNNGNELYNELIISDLLIKNSTNGWRSWKSNPGTVIEFKSKQPVTKP